MDLLIDTRKKFKIFFDPMRQDILNTIKSSGSALTIDEVAKSLDLSNSKTHYHMKKLEEIGAICWTYETVVNGIVSKHFELAYNDVNIRQNPEDHLTDEVFQNEQLRYISNLVDQNLQGVLEAGKTVNRQIQNNIKNFGLHFFDEDVYLSYDKRKELKDMINDFIHENQVKPEDMRQHTKTHIHCQIYDIQIGTKEEG